MQPSQKAKVISRELSKDYVPGARPDTAPDTDRNFAQLYFEYPILEGLADYEQFH
jgi:hypothetical protein